MDSLFALQLKAINVHLDNDGNVCLNDLHLAQGSPVNRDPRQWKRKEGAAFIEATAQILNVPEKHIIKSKRGKGGGTYAHKQVALAYAKYLSPELHYVVNQAFLERLREEKEPELTIDRGIKGLRRQGLNEEQISLRLRSKAQRIEFAGTLKQHGVVNNGPHDNGYRICTNAIYTPLFGGGTNVIRQKKSLPKRANIRDNLSSVELAAVTFAEALASENIKIQRLYGNSECANECVKVSSNVACAVKISRTSQPAT